MRSFRKKLTNCFDLRNEGSFKIPGLIWVWHSGRTAVTDTGKVVQVLDSVGGADDLQYDPATSRIYFVGTTGTIAVFKEMDPDHFRLLGKVPTGAISKTGLWVPELNRFYSAVPKHFVLTARHGTDDIQADLFKELSITQGAVKPPKEGWATSILSDLITEDAHLMIFDYAPQSPCSELDS